MKRLFACVLILAILVLLPGCVTFPPLHDAASRGDINTVKALLDKGTNVNEWKYGTPLMMASAQGKYDVVKLLIDRGADVNVMSQGGWSALGFAAENGHTAVMEILIEKGADIDKVIAGLEQRAAFFAKSPSVPAAVARCQSGISRIREMQSTLPNKNGWAYYSKGQYQNAINSFKQAISLNPSISSNYRGLSASYNALKQYDEAITAAKRAIELKPDFANAYNDLGIAYFHKKQFDDALNAHQKAVEINPKDANLYTNIGYLFLERGNYGRAVEAYKKGIEAAPSNPDLREALAEAYYRMGKYDDALAAADRAMDLQTFTGIGINLSIEGGYPAAMGVMNQGPAKRADIQAGDKIIDIDGKSTKGWNIEQVVKSIKGSGSAQVVLTIDRNDNKIKKTVARERIVSEEAASCIGLRSLIYRHKGDMNRAFQDAEMALTLKPSDGNARLSLGAAYLDRGQYDESIKLLSQIKISLTARLLEATAFAKQGEMKLAVNFYSSIVNKYSEEVLSPKNIPLMNDQMALLQTFKPIVKEHRDKARSFESKGQYKEALSELSEALKTADDREAQTIQETAFSMLRRNPLLSEVPEDARKYALRSEMLVKEGNFEQAAAELRKAIQIAPYAAQLYYNSALINAELKKYPEAMRHMKIYLKAMPDAPAARAAKDEIIKWEFMVEKGK